MGPDHAANLLFILEKELIYHVDHKNYHRLYIPRSVFKEVFELAYNQIGYPEYYRIYTRIIECLYIYCLSKRLYKYIRYYPKCQINKTPRHKSYGDIQPILTPLIPFYIITLNFILALPLSKEGFNTVISIIYKFSKRVTFIPGKKTFTA